MIDNKTIAAIATPIGVSATGMIRVSGDNAIALIDKAFKGKALEKQKANTLHYGRIEDADGTAIDEVVAGIFRSPRSFTGEDVVEISCHGSPYVLQKVMEVLFELGIRQAEAGEFTRRAFLNGKMDLSMAEAVGDLIHSESEAAHRSAMSQLKGGISEKVKVLREELVSFTSLLELELDFSEEDVEFADRTRLEKLLKKIKHEVDLLIASFRTGKMVKQGVGVAIVGKPNAGKSTLLNQLLQEEKAIVSSIAGTTRDVIEDVAEIGGVLFRFYDTAGLRETEDEIEGIGVERARKKITQADVVLFLFDVGDADSEEVQAEVAALPEEKPLLKVANKIDLDPDWKKRFPNSLGIASKEGRNLEELKEQLLEKVGLAEGIADYSHVTTLRHVESLKRISNSIGEVEKAFAMGVSSELVVQDIKLALEAMGEITGEVTNDEILGNIFSKFCIGK